VGVRGSLWRVLLLVVALGVQKPLSNWFGNEEYGVCIAMQPLAGGGGAGAIAAAVVGVKCVGVLR
jgi:hypothetical protein